MRVTTNPEPSRPLSSSNHLLTWLYIALIPGCIPESGGPDYASCRQVVDAAAYHMDDYFFAHPFPHRSLYAVGEGALFANAYRRIHLLLDVSAATRGSTLFDPAPRGGTAEECSYYCRMWHFNPPSSLDGTCSVYAGWRIARLSRDELA